MALPPGKPAVDPVEAKRDRRDREDDQDGCRARDEGRDERWPAPDAQA
jgi:hypothetical protein